MTGLISREKAIKSLAKEYLRRNTYGDEELRLAWAEKAIDDVPDEPVWIPSARALPNTEQRVLCCTATQKGTTNMVIGYHDGERWCCGMNSNVIAWTRLPDPPEVQP